MNLENSNKVVDTIDPEKQIAFIKQRNEGQEAMSGSKPLCLTHRTVRTEAIHAVL